MMITDEDMEWATVDRMRGMLVKVHDDYKVTHTYALFTTILCWVIQRIRTSGAGRIERRAQSVLETLKNELISDQPWGIWTIGADDQQLVQDIPRRGPFPEFDGFTAARFLTALRNATAHGDARNIRPVNRGNILVGHEFHCSETDERRRVTWHGQIVLERRDMQRIGIALAVRYCEALADHRDGGVSPDFEANARSIREEAA